MTNNQMTNDPGLSSLTAQHMFSHSRFHFLPHFLALLVSLIFLEGLKQGILRLRQ
jgi:hypothetical protein